MSKIITVGLDLECALLPGQYQAAILTDWRALWTSY